MFANRDANSSRVESAEMPAAVSERPQEADWSRGVSLPSTPLDTTEAPASGVPRYRWVPKTLEDWQERRRENLHDVVTLTVLGGLLLPVGIAGQPIAMVGSIALITIAAVQELPRLLYSCWKVRQLKNETQPTSA